MNVSIASTGTRQAIAVLNALGEGTTSLRDRWRFGTVEQRTQVLRQLPAGEPRGGDRTADTKAFELPGVLGLIVRHRHHHLRQSCGQALRERADSAVMHQRTAPRKQLAKRREPNMAHGVGQVGG